MFLYVSTNIIEDKIKVLFKAILQTMRFTHFLQCLGMLIKYPILVYEGNESATDIANIDKLIPYLYYVNVLVACMRNECLLDLLM